jgi:nitroimidazol reductase NimA-like FMN-containing flavoprotein (pyridoxamine 5'-phosphate oxidase superfamily)
MAASEHLQVRQRADRGFYDNETIHRVLDAGFVCHVGFIQDKRPIVIPTSYVRLEDRLYLHGSDSSRLLRHFDNCQALACITVTHVDAISMARSALNHSINYRSVVVFGKPVPVQDYEHKLRVLHALVDHIVPGRWDSLRPITTEEIERTRIVGIALDEASVKIRSGPPEEGAQDRSLPIWAGTVPLSMVSLPPIVDSHVPEGVALPLHARSYAGPGVKPITALTHCSESETDKKD